jgi:hypothetical protein
MKYRIPLGLVDEFLSNLSYKELEQTKEELQHCTPMPEIQRLIERVELFMQNQKLIELQKKREEGGNS